MKSASVLGLGVALATLSAPVGAVPQDFAAKADRIVANAWPAGGPGAAVIVTEAGKPVYERERGLADIGAKTPITRDTVFRIGSITKQFSAAVVLQLAAEGKLSLDDPLSKYFPDYPQPGAGATVRQLLNHTSGIQSYTDIPGWMVEANFSKPFTNDQMIAVFRDLPSPSKPGEAWAYNNSGYFLLGAIIEKVTAKPWHQVVRERLAGPLQLTSLRYGVEEGSVATMAKPYAGVDGKFGSAPTIHMSVPGAAGALIGTVGDLATWADALHHGRVVDPASYKAMTTKGKTSDDKETTYGFGLQISEIRGHRTIGHGGGIPGFITSSVYLPENDVFVAIFTNSAPPVTSPDEIATKLAMLAIGDPFPELQKQPVDLKAVQPLLGLYKIDGEEAERIFFASDGKLFTRRTGGSETEVFPAGNNRFFYDGSVTWFDMKPGATPVMHMYQSGAKTPQLARRAGPVPAEEKPAEVARATLERYVGRYAVGGAFAVVTLGADGLSMKLGPQPTLRLVPSSPTEFRVQGVDAKVAFNAEGDGPAKSLTIHQGGRTMEAPRAE